MVAVTLVGGTLVAATVVAACAQPLHDGSWDDLVTARQQDAIDRGWVPEWLPESATDVVEQDRPSTREVVVRAHLPADEWLDACTPTDDVPDPPDLAPTWWDLDPGAAALACEQGWSARRGGDMLWAWATDPEVPS